MERVGEKYPNLEGFANTLVYRNPLCSHWRDFHGSWCPLLVVSQFLSLVEVLFAYATPSPSDTTPSYPVFAVFRLSSFALWFPFGCDKFLFLQSLSRGRQWEEVHARSDERLRPYALQTNKVYINLEEISVIVSSSLFLSLHISLFSDIMYSRLLSFLGRGKTDER